MTIVLPARLVLLAATVFLPNVFRPARSCDANAPLALPADRRATLPKTPGDAVPTIDDRWAEMAISSPGGFAGSYVESPAATTAVGAKPTHRLVVRLARPAERDTALKVLVPKLRMIGGPDVDHDGVVIVPARWDFSQLVEWRRFLEPHAHAVAKVVSTDLDAVQNRIAYVVATATDRAALVEHLGTLHIPCGLVHVTVRGQKG